MRKIAIHLEGPDGVGKSSLVSKLQVYLDSFEGLSVSQQHFPISVRNTDPSKKGASAALPYLNEFSEWVDSAKTQDEDILLIDRSFFSTAIYQSRNFEEAVHLLRFGSLLFREEFLNIIIMLHPGNSVKLYKEIQKRGGEDAQKSFEEIDLLCKKYMTTYNIIINGKDEYFASLKRDFGEFCSENRTYLMSINRDFSGDKWLENLIIQSAPSIKKALVDKKLIGA